MTETATVSRAQRFRARIPVLLVWYCRIVALASILSALSPRTNERIDRLPDYILFSLGFLLGVPSIGFGVLILMLGAAVRRRKRIAWWLLMVLGLFVGPLGWLAISALLYNVTSSDLRPLAPLIVVVRGPGAVHRPGDLGAQGVLRGVRRRQLPAGPGRARRVARALDGARRHPGGLERCQPRHRPGDQALYTLKAGMAGTGIWWYDTAVQVPHWVDVTVNLIGSVMILAVAWALFQPRRGTVRHQPEDDDRLRTLLDKFGDQDSLGYFNLRRDKAVVWSPVRQGGDRLPAGRRGLAGLRRPDRGRRGLARGDRGVARRGPAARLGPGGDGRLARRAARSWPGSGWTPSNSATRRWSRSRSSRWRAARCAWSGRPTTGSSAPATPTRIRRHAEIPAEEMAALVAPAPTTGATAASSAASRWRWAGSAIRPTASA